MDVYVKDGDRIFDIEMQAGHFEHLALRAPYYQSVIDSTTIRSGKGYGSLKESYVIFICTGDLFWHGLPVYTVRHTFAENGQLYDDKTHKLFYNVKAFAVATDEEVKGFLRYVGTGTAETEYAREIMYAVNKAKMMDPDFCSYYYAAFAHETDVREEGIEIGLQRGREEGLAQGEHKARIETARALLFDGLAIENAVKYTGLPIEEVRSLANS